MSTPDTKLMASFFTWTWGTRKGFVCISSEHRDSPAFKNTFFEWPKQKNELVAYVDNQRRHHHVWFCVAVLSKADRKRVNAQETDIVYADLDECHPDKLAVPPHAIWQSSPGRYQALWRLDEILDPYEVQAIARRVARAYKDEGVDKSGWDAAQLLRVPFTYNFKPEYADEEGRPPRVELLSVTDDRISKDAFDVLPEVDEELSYEELDAPNPTEYGTTEEIIGQFYPLLKEKGFNGLYSYEPEIGADWSANMWRLINVCLEVSMSKEETYVVCLSAKCNKYARDGRPPLMLWREILKAHEYQNTRGIVDADNMPVLSMPMLVTPDEEKQFGRILVDDYVDWASEVTDASPDFHALSFYCGVSMLIANGLKLELSYDTLHANIWGLILGDSTLARKTTAMKLVMGMVEEIDPDIVVATDASSEGLLTGLQARPSQVSVYYRDEVSGFFSDISKKEYLHGMPELMAALYDVPASLRRTLRKERIIAEKPYFIFFGGGIAERTYELMTENMILSGFLPRFLVATGKTDMKRIRRTGPSRVDNKEKRDEFKKELARLNMLYGRYEDITIAGQTTAVHAMTEVQLTAEAWKRYQHIEGHMTEVAFSSVISDLALPSFERLSRSLLKLTMLTAAIRRDPVDNLLIADEEDVMYAARFIQQWGQTTVDIVLNCGKPKSERMLGKVYEFVKLNPGTTRGIVMKRYSVSARDMTEIQATLEQRGVLTVRREGKAHIYHAV